jgi:hypothetical protein
MLVVLALAVVTVPAARAEEETPLSAAPAPAPEKKPADGLPEEFWYIDEAVRARVAADPNVMALYDKAVAAKARRRTAGLVLYCIGGPMVLASFVIYVAPHDIGFHDLNQAEMVAYIGASTGALGLIVPAALVRAVPSPSEKRYFQYMKDRYDVIPVVELPHLRADGVFAWNAVHLRF